MINILVLSVGTRNKIIQYFKKELQGKGKVVATDMSRLAPALYEADAFYIVPRMTDPGYIEKILEICKKEESTGVLSLIDPELSLIAQNKGRFMELGTCVIGSDYEVCERSLNKWEMYQWLEHHHYRCAKSYIDKKEFFVDVEKGEAKYPVFVKPVCGSASIAISKVYDRETINLLFDHNDGLMIQEYLEGQEIGADCYIDLISGKLVSVFTKKKLVMRAGETDKAVSFIDPVLNELIQEFVTEMGYRGQIDIDVFENGGKYYISEVNPRFGGGYPHAYECGVNHMRLIVNNLEKKVNQNREPDYEEGIFMMKYNEISILNGGKENAK